MIITPSRIIRSSLAAVAGVALFWVIAPCALAEEAPPAQPAQPAQTVPAPAATVSAQVVPPSEPAAPAESPAPAAPAAPAEPAESSSIGLPQGTVLVPEGHSMAELGAVIVNTLLKREWIVTSKTDGRIVAKIDHRGEQATLTVDYSTTQIDFYSTSAAPGKAKGAAHVPGWVSNLRKDLNKYFYPKAGKK